MSFSMGNCTVLQRRNKSRAVDCYKGIYKYNYCLTPYVLCGLRVWLDNKMSAYGKGRFNPIDVENDVAELLRSCCKISRVCLITQHDVLQAEDDLIKHIKYAIDTTKFSGIYTAELPVWFEQQYNIQQIQSIKDLQQYLLGVPVY